MSGSPNPTESPNPEATTPQAPEQSVAPLDRTLIGEIGGRPGPEPTRYGDWEKAGRCIDF